MAPLFSLASAVQPSKMQWALKLRLVRAYELPGYGNHSEAFSFECVFHDEQGVRIHATIKGPLIRNFKPLFKEGHLYAVKNFVVADNNMKYKTTTNKYKMIFIAKTHVFEMLDNTFPCHVYELKSFAELSTVDNLDETQLFDIIGNVVARHAPQNKELYGRTTKLIDVVLEDIENNRMSCTLWGEYADEMIKYLDNGGSDPVIMILQMCRAKLFRGEVRVSNTFYVTKMILNGEVEEITEFRNKLITGSHATSNTISQISTSSVCTITDELSSGKGVLRKLEQLCENNEIGSFWVYAKIVAIETVGDWSYLACKKCPKKVNQVGKRFYCEKCDRFDVTGNPRFKIQVRVVDDTGNAPFLLWDRECVELIGKTASELRAEAAEKSTNYVIPSEIESLVEQKVLFKVQVRADHISNHTGAYTVMKLTCDPNVISKFCSSCFEDQESDIFSKLENTNFEDEKVFSSNDEVSMSLKTQPKLTDTSDLHENDSVKRSLIGEFSSIIPLKKTKESNIFSKRENADIEDEKVLSSKDVVSTPLNTQRNLTDSSGLHDDDSVKRSLITEFESTIPPKKTKVMIKQEK